MLADFLATFTALFSVTNPFGAMPVFVSLTRGYTHAAQRQQALKTCIYIVGVLVVFFFAGTFILKFFGLRLDDLRVAGGLLIIKSGLALLNPEGSERGGDRISEEVEQEGIDKADISFTPMAMPMLSGPGAIAVTISMNGASSSAIDQLMIVFSIVLVAAFCYLTLLFSPQMVRYLGKGGMAALARMMGFIVLSIGVSFVVDGLLSLIG
ncbi:MAG: MarC family protein [Catalinimonas sp.]